jgi:ribose/xylose/arabinose/galactoside ABC-type transport system permease subunit
LPWAFHCIAIIIALIFVQRKTILGKYVAAIGGNQTAAELSESSSVKYVWILYVIVWSFAAAEGGAASYMSLGDPLSGDQMELACIIAVLLGGTAFRRRGSVAKTMIGAIIIMCVTTGLMTVIPAYWQTLATGSVLLIASQSITSWRGTGQIVRWKECSCSRCPLVSMKKHCPPLTVPENSEFYSSLTLHFELK